MCERRIRENPAESTPRKAGTTVELADTEALGGKDRVELWDNSVPLKSQLLDWPWLLL